MRNLTLRGAGLSALFLSAVAQAQFVSPVGYAQQEGNSNNTWPWSSTQFTYQQVHGDTQGTPRLIQGLSFRRDTGFDAFPSSTPRTVTLDAFIGMGSLATATATYASNYSAPPTQVVTSKTFNAPDWAAASIARPALWSFTIAFDAPYVYLGTGDLVWEFRISLCSATGTYLTDFCSGAAVQTGYGNRLGLGTGCTTSNGQTTLLSNWTTTAATHILNWQLTGAPSSATTAVAVGFFPVVYPLAGLCGSGNIYSDGLLFVTSGTTSSVGAVTLPNIPVPYNPWLIGSSLYAQSASLDASQPIGFSVSNGLKSTLSDTGPGIQCARIASGGVYAATSGSIYTNNALVTLFR